MQIIILMYCTVQYNKLLFIYIQNRARCPAGSVEVVVVRLLLLQPVVQLVVVQLLSFHTRSL